MKITQLAVKKFRGLFENQCSIRVALLYDPCLWRGERIKRMLDTSIEKLCIEKGMKMDIYESDFRGRNVLVGVGVVYETKPNWSILKINKKYIDRPLKPGLIVRGKL